MKDRPAGFCTATEGLEVASPYSGIGNERAADDWNTFLEEGSDCDTAAGDDLASNPPRYHVQWHRNRAATEETAAYTGGEESGPLYPVNQDGVEGHSSDSLDLDGRRGNSSFEGEEGECGNAAAGSTPPEQPLNFTAMSTTTVRSITTAYSTGGTGRRSSITVGPAAVLMPHPPPAAQLLDPARTVADARQTRSMVWDASAQWERERVRAAAATATAAKPTWCPTSSFTAATKRRQQGQPQRRQVPKRGGPPLSKST